MKPSERKALLLLISGVEGQIQAIKSYLISPSLGGSHTVHKTTRVDSTAPYTSEEEDDKIAEALEIQATDNQQFLRGLVDLADEGEDVTPEQ